MIKNYFKIFVFLFFLNSVSQNIETVEVKKDQKISSFISDYEISASDFFILKAVRGFYEIINLPFDYWVLTLSASVICAVALFTAQMLRKKIISKSSS